MKYESILTTPQLVSDQLNKATLDSTTDIQTEYSQFYTLVKRYCRAYSEVVAEATNRAFVEYYDTRTIYLNIAWRNNSFRSTGYGFYVLDLNDDLLSVDSITVNGTAIDSDYYHLVGEGYGSYEYPYTRIMFNSAAVSIPVYTDFSSAVVVTGTWGVQNNSSARYSSVDTLKQAVGSATTTSIYVNDASLFAVYQYIKVNDEMMLVTDTNTSTDILTVERGVHGFTADTHDLGDTVYVWNVVPDVEEAVTRMAAYFYQRRNDFGNRVQLAKGVVITSGIRELLATVVRRRSKYLSGAG